MPAADASAKTRSSLSVHRTVRQVAREVVLEASPSLFASRWRHPPLTEGQGHSWRSDWAALHRLSPGSLCAGEVDRSALSATPGRGAANLVLVHLASSSADALGWLGQLRQAAQSDQSWQSDTFLGSVQGHALAAMEEDRLQDINEPRRTVQGPILRNERQHLCVVMDALAQAPMGYCAYSLAWSAIPVTRDNPGLELALDVQEVWLAPAARRQQAGRRLQQWLCTAAQGAVDDFQRKLGVRARQARAAQGPGISAAPRTAQVLALNLILSSGAGEGGTITPSPSSTMFLSELLGRLHRNLVQHARSCAPGAGADEDKPESAPRLRVGRVSWEG